MNGGVFVCRDRTSGLTSYIENTLPDYLNRHIKRKIKAIMNAEEDDGTFKDMLAYWAEAYIKGIEIMSKLQESCGAIYEDLFDLEQQYNMVIYFSTPKNFE